MGYRYRKLHNVLSDCVWNGPSCRALAAWGGGAAARCCEFVSGVCNFSATSWRRSSSWVYPSSLRRIVESSIRWSASSVFRWGRVSVDYRCCSISIQRIRL
jgi:hypothetical protein